MPPFEVLILALSAVVVTVLFALVMSSRRAVRRLQTKADRALSESINQEIRRPSSRKPTVTLSPTQIALINIERHRRHRPMLNRVGLKSAISHPWDRWDVRQPTNSADWINYLIMYEVFAADHTGASVHVSGNGLTIDPNQPYNGGGGEFAGAGASGEWTVCDKGAGIAPLIAPTPPISVSVGSDTPLSGGGSGGSDSYSSSSSSDSSSSSSDSSSSSSSDSSSSSSYDSSSSSSSFDSGSSSVSVDSGSF